MPKALLLSALLAVPSASWTPSGAQQDAPQRVGFDHLHRAWDALLRDLVHGGGLVDYRGLAKRRPELDGRGALLRLHGGVGLELRRGAGEVTRT
jgi:hypothetical protein